MKIPTACEARKAVREEEERRGAAKEAQRVEEERHAERRRAQREARRLDGIEAEIKRRLPGIRHRCAMAIGVAMRSAETSAEIEIGEWCRYHWRKEPNPPEENDGMTIVNRLFQALHTELAELSSDDASYRTARRETVVSWKTHVRGDADSYDTVKLWMQISF